MKNLFFILSFLCLTAGVAIAQPITEAQVEAALQLQGVSEDEIMQAVAAEGIDPTKVDKQKLINQLMQKGVDFTKPEEVKAAAIAILKAEQAAIVATPAPSNDPKPEGTVAPTLSPNTTEPSATNIVQEIISTPASKKEEAVVEAKVEEAIEAAVEAIVRPIYGQSFFNDQTIPIIVSPTATRPRETYIIGSGDEFSISIFGYGQDLSKKLTVTDEGYITESGFISRTYVRGLTFKKAKDLIISRLRQSYDLTGASVEINLNYSRMVNINIFGEVRKPGSYNIPALNTAFNALTASGGFTEIGSVRRIELRRAGSPTKTLDVYKFLSDPLVAESFYLEDGDYILVRALGNVIELNGAVKRQARYELLENEGLKELIEYAGGFEANALKKRIQVRRLDDDKVVLYDVDFTDLMRSGKNFKLQGGDIVTVKIVSTENFNQITVSGAVRYDGDYAIDNNTRLLDIMKKAITDEDARLDTIYLVRLDDTKVFRDYIPINLEEVLKNPSSAQNFVLKNQDQIIVTRKSVFIEGGTLSTEGSLRHPSNFVYDANMTIRDLVFLSDGLDKNAADIAYIIRTRKDNTKEYLKLDLLAALKDSSYNASIELKPFDVLRVFNKTTFYETYELSISGLVRNPIERIAYDSSLTIRDLIYFANGVRDEASNVGYLIRTDDMGEKEYFRFNLNEILDEKSNVNNAFKLMPRDEVRIFQKIVDKYNVSVTGMVRNEVTLQFDSTLTVRDLLSFAQGLQETASETAYLIRTDEFGEKEYLRVNLGEVLRSESLNQQIKLRPRDVLRVFPIVTEKYTVSITGYVYNAGDFQYDKSLKLKDLIYFAGGLKPEAVTSRIEISRVIIQEGEPTEIIVATVDVDANGNLEDGGTFDLQPYDRVYVRKSPRFELQKTVTIQGEVNYPGEYVIIGENETLRSIIKRAGGFTDEAFLDGAELRRRDENLGAVVMDLKKAMRRNGSRFNYVVKEGDIIIIPETNDLVAIQGVVDYPELGSGKINVPYHKFRRAKFFVDRYAGGVNKESGGDASTIIVKYPNGYVGRTINLGLFNIYPKVEAGSLISVRAKKEEKTPEGETEKKEIDWENLVTRSLAQITAVVTLFVLLERASQ